jgi:hypothetical protein
MIAIIRPPKYITARAHPILLAELFGTCLLIVMRRAQAGESVEWREGLRHAALFPTALGDRDSVVDHLRRHNLAALKASFAARMRGELHKPESFPASRRIRPAGHALASTL